MSSPRNTSSPRSTPSGHGSCGRREPVAGAGSQGALPRQARPECTQLHISADILQRLHEATAQTPEIDYDKIARVRRAMLCGELRLDAHRLADKLIRFESDLF